jgi:hypothetical protein
VQQTSVRNSDLSGPDKDCDDLKNERELQLLVKTQYGAAGCRVGGFLDRERAHQPLSEQRVSSSEGGGCAGKYQLTSELCG